MCGLIETTCPACDNIYKHEFHRVSHCGMQAGFCPLESRSIWLIQGVTGVKCDDCYLKLSLSDPKKAEKERAEESDDLVDHLERIMHRETPEESGQDDETARLSREEWDREQRASDDEKRRKGFRKQNEAPRMARIGQQQQELNRIRYAVVNRQFVNKHANPGSRREGI